MKHITLKQFKTICEGDTVRYITFGGVERTAVVVDFQKSGVVLENHGGYPYERIIEIIPKSVTNNQKEG
jgi:hypothetical protein